MPRRRAALEPQPHAADLVPEVAGRILQVADEPFGRVLDRRVEDLAARHVRAERVDLPFAAGEAEGEIGLGADDPDCLGAVEVLGDALHPLPQRLPVDQDRAVEEVLEGRQRQSGVLGGRRVG